MMQKVLKKTIINNTITICNLLNNLNTTSLYSTKPIQRAIEEQWIVGGFAPIMAVAYSMTLADNEAAFTEIRETKLDPLLAQLDLQLQAMLAIHKGPFFSGKSFSMADVHFAPQLKRFQCIADHYGTDLLLAFPHIKTWAKAVLTYPTVLQILGPETEFLSHLNELYELKGSFLVAR